MHKTGSAVGRNAGTLDARLRTVAQMVPRGSRVADVGTDHGRLALALVASGRAAYCVATELDGHRLAKIPTFPPGHPLRDRVILRKGYGLRPIRPGDRIEVAVLAGIGHRTLRRILDDPVRERLDLRRLVLQPQGDWADVRRWIRDHRWHAAEERMVWCRGRFYTVIAAEAGPAAEETVPLGDEDLLEAGRHLVRRRDPTAARYWQAQQRRLARIVAGPGSGTKKQRARRSLERARRILAVLECEAERRAASLL